MAETERRQRVITSTPRLTPDEIANRSFGSSFRGYAENEVRAFLRRISEEFDAGRERERELVEAVDQLEEQLRAPKPLSEQELLDALGEETARLLRSARDAADDIRRKAEERSASVMEEAQADANRLRTEAAEILDVRTQEAEAAASEIMGRAEARAEEIRVHSDREVEEQRMRAETEVGSVVEDARQQGRQMLDEARAARERVLLDLGRRRALLQAQVEELRQGRDHLLDAYRVVKRTFLEATEALAQVESRAASERAHAPAYVHDAATDAETDALATEATTLAQDAPDTVETATDDASETLAEIPGPVAPPAPDLAAVDSLFARIRAGQSEPGEGVSTADGGSREQESAPAGTADDGETVAPAGAESPTSAEAVEPVDSTIEGPAPPHEREAHVDQVEHSEQVGQGEAAEDTPPSGEGAGRVPAGEVDAGVVAAADAWRARHRAAVDPLVSPLVKRAKRSAQDDQNALLDAVRRHKGRPSAAQVLRDDEVVVAAWCDVLRAAIEDAYSAGREAIGAKRDSAPDDLVREAAGTVAFPLRDRLVVAIDDLDSGDTSGLVERIGARYREWKNQQLERALGDVMVAAWSRGVYDGSDDGTVLHWVPITEGRCADCDDNALEPTTKGATFPTGQARPPAHPGCRCLLAPAGVLTARSRR